MATKEFTVSIDGQDVEFIVRSPTLNDQREAQKVYNQAFTDAVTSGSVVRAKMDDLLKEQGLWNDKKEEEFKSLQKELLNNEKRLAKGGIKLLEAKELAIKMQELRDSMRQLIGNRTSLDNHSAEGQADNSRFNYLASACVLRKADNSKYFSSLEEYLNKGDDPVAVAGAQTLANMLYGLDSNYEKNLPENKFLTKYKFMDDKFRFVNNEGKLVDREGRLINEDGRFIDKEGNLIDKFGNRVDANGDFVVESEPFLDDSGNPIVEKEPETKPVPVVEEVKVEKKE
jgi:hypothetical protein